MERVKDKRGERSVGGVVARDGHYPHDDFTMPRPATPLALAALAVAQRLAQPQPLPPLLPTPAAASDAAPTTRKLARVSVAAIAAVARATFGGLVGEEQQQQADRREAGEEAVTAGGGAGGSRKQKARQLRRLLLLQQQSGSSGRGNDDADAAAAASKPAPSSSSSASSRVVAPAVLAGSLSAAPLIAPPRAKRARPGEEATAGRRWFDMAAPELTQELKRDLLVLKHRAFLDPKRHYKTLREDQGLDKGAGRGKGGLPRFFQVGTVVESGGGGLISSAVAPAADRRARATYPSLVAGLLADDVFRSYAKRNYEAVQRRGLDSRPHVKKAKRDGFGARKLGKPGSSKRH